MEYQGFDQVQARVRRGPTSQESGIDEVWGTCLYDICDGLQLSGSIISDLEASSLFFSGFPMFFYVHLVVRKMLDFAPCLGQSGMQHHHVVQDVPSFLCLFDVVQYRCCAIAKWFVDFHRFSGEQMSVLRFLDSN